MDFQWMSIFNAELPSTKKVTRNVATSTPKRLVVLFCRGVRSYQCNTLSRGSFIAVHILRRCWRHNSISFWRVFVVMVTSLHHRVCVAVLLRITFWDDSDWSHCHCPIRRSLQYKCQSIDIIDNCQNWESLRTSKDGVFYSRKYPPFAPPSRSSITFLSGLNLLLLGPDGHPCLERDRRMEEAEIKQALFDAYKDPSKQFGCLDLEIYCFFFCFSFFL